MGWLWLFTTDLSNTAAPPSQFLSMSLSLPFLLGVSVDGLGRGTWSPSQSNPNL